MPRVTERQRNLVRHRQRERERERERERKKERERELLCLHKWKNVSSELCMCACAAFSLKGNVIHGAERVGLLEGRFFMAKMKETNMMLISTSCFTMTS